MARDGAILTGDAAGAKGIGNVVVGGLGLGFTAQRLLADSRVERLMVEGGGKVHTQFLTDNLADELQLVGKHKLAGFFLIDCASRVFSATVKTTAYVPATPLP